MCWLRSLGCLRSTEVEAESQHLSLWLADSLCVKLQSLRSRVEMLNANEYHGLCPVKLCVTDVAVAFVGGLLAGLAGLVQHHRVLRHQGSEGTRLLLGCFKIVSL